MANNKRDKGMAKFAEVMQFEAPDIAGDAFLDATYKHLFAEVWSGGSLSVRDRRLITLSLLMCFGNEMTLNLHLGAARKSGDLSDAEIDALIVHVAHYAGWPSAAVASQVMRGLRAEQPEQS